MLFLRSILSCREHIHIFLHLWFHYLWPDWTKAEQTTLQRTSQTLNRSCTIASTRYHDSFCPFQNVTFSNFLFFEVSIASQSNWIFQTAAIWSNRPEAWMKNRLHWTTWKEPGKNLLCFSYQFFFSILQHRTLSSLSIIIIFHLHH